jgi:hypothetical protein
MWSAAVRKGGVEMPEAPELRRLEQWILYFRRVTALLGTKGSRIAQNCG